MERERIRYEGTLSTGLRVWLSDVVSDNGHSEWLWGWTSDIPVMKSDLSVRDVVVEMRGGDRLQRNAIAAMERYYGEAIALRRVASATPFHDVGKQEVLVRRKGK